MFNPLVKSDLPFTVFAIATSLVVSGAAISVVALMELSDRSAVISTDLKNEMKNGEKQRVTLIFSETISSELKGDMITKFGPHRTLDSKKIEVSALCAWSDLTPYLGKGLLKVFSEGNKKENF